ncbi:MAG: choice-of-anchor Q domain-containing protein, partial [Thermoanaerobaculia bacterium]
FELTQTHELPDGSAAVDSGGCVLPALAFDQRGVARPQGIGCDVGSVERSEPSCNGLFMDGFEGASFYRWSDSTP